MPDAIGAVAAARPARAMMTVMQTADKEGIGAERRRYTRHTFTGRLYYRGSVYDEGRGIDISEGGVGFRSRHALSPGAPLDVIFLNRSVTVSGIVRYHAEEAEGWHRVGVEFEQREPDVLNVLLSTNGG